MFTSDTVKDSVLAPLVVSVRLKVPVPVYGGVPPVADTVQLKALPMVPDAGQLTVTTIGLPETATDADPEALTALASVTVKDSVLGPLVVSVLLNVPVPVYGATPPVADTVQLKATLTVALAGQETVTTRG